MMRIYSSFGKLVSIAVLVCVICLLLSTSVAMASKASPPGVAYFPASYQSALNALQQKYPNWQFVALNTGLDWNTVIANQTPPFPNNRSLVPVSFEAAMKDTSYTAQIEPGWVRASAGAVRYYMDPRNFLDERNVFQFELLSYNSATHKQSGIESILAGTFMTDASNTPHIRYYNTSGTISTITKSYPQAIMDAGIANRVSPYYLAAKIRQEVVLSGGGASGSVSGRYPGYPGIYNFYNIGATSGVDPVANGLNWARNSANGNGTPWTDPIKSINGGAGWIARGYINVGQDTVYLQKYNVAPSDPSQLYWHQYMTNVAGAFSEGQKLYNGYASIGMLAQPKVFYIPVYNNMPANPCYRPSGFPDSDSSLYYLNSSGINIRRGPGTGFASYGTYPEGTTVRVRNLNHTVANGYTWAEIEFSNGDIGYVANQFLTRRMVTAPLETTAFPASDSRIAYVGSWSTSTSTVYASGQARHSRQDRAQATIKFKGSGIEWHGARLPWGGFVDVYINGKFQRTVNTNAPTAAYRQMLFSVQGLDKNRTHEMLLVNVKAPWGAPETILIDRIVVTEGQLENANPPTTGAMTQLQSDGDSPFGLSPLPSYTLEETQPVGTGVRIDNQPQSERLVP